MLSEEQIKEIFETLGRLPPEEQKIKAQEILSKLKPEEIKQLQSFQQKANGEQQCPFCLMTEGKIETKKIYDDDRCFAILDIKPANKGHILLIPKKHFAVLTKVDDSLIGHLFIVANHLSEIIYEVVDAQGTNLIAANGPLAGQGVPHALINIIPRFEKDQVQISWMHKEVSEEEMSELQKKISEKASQIKLTKQVEIIEEENKTSELQPRTKIP